MDFEEYLLAMGDNLTYDLIKKHFENKKPLKNIHKK